MATYKKSEFKKFLGTLKWGSTAHWVDIAKSIGVDDDTLRAWRELPEAQEAIQEGIDNAIASMKQAGSKDWRMWEAKLKMLGVNPTSKVEVDINDPRKNILEEYKLGADGAGKTQEAESGSSTHTA